MKSRSAATEENSDAPLEPETTPSAYGFVLRELQDSNGGPGRTLAFRNARITPLDHDALAGARLNRPVTIPVDFRHATVVTTDIDDVAPDARVSVTSVLESPFSAEAISLLPGGWLPSGFAIARENATVLIDRNVMTQIEGRFRPERSPALGQDFLDLFAEHPIRINPLLHVLENRHRRRPTRAELGEELEKVVAKLGAALPKATIMVGPRSLDAAEGLVADGAESSERNRTFLREVAPRLTGAVGRARRPALWDDVVAAADRHGVRRNGLVLLAVLSAIAVPNGKSPARAVLKFTDAFDDGDAYNALADLRSLEIFCALLSMFPEESLELCTGDKALALLWTGMRASNFEWIGDRARFDLSPVEALLPGASLKRWQTMSMG